MKLNYIIEICIALDIAILSISYPIIIDKISNIGEKYSSDYLFKVFKFEFPQKELSCLKGVSTFQFVLYFTVFTFLFQIFQFEPLFGIDNWIINNSADILVFISTFFLIIFLFIWLNKVFLFIGKSNNLLEFLIKKYKAAQNDSQLKNYYLKTINEFTIYSIQKQDEHLQNNLLDFYATEITQINKKFESNEQVVYPNEYYSLIFNICKRLAKIDNNNLEAIEHRAVSGNWLIGGGFENNTISNLSFEWLWRNVYTICNNVLNANSGLTP